MSRILIITTILIGLFVAPIFAQQGDPPQAVPADVQALKQSLSNAGCNAALNAAANEIIKLRKEVTTLQAQSMVGKSGATKK